MRFNSMIILLAIGFQLQISEAAPGEGFGEALTPPVTALKRESVEKLLILIPKLAEATAGKHHQLMGNFAGGTPDQSMSHDEMERLNRIYVQHGFSMEEFVMQISALMATYFVLEPTAFESMLLSPEHSEIKLKLADPNFPASEKRALLKQIEYVQKNKHLFLEQFEKSTNAANKKLVKSLLPKIRAAFEKAQKSAKKP
ncbi:MAG: hypothetical protein VYA34_01470 [Myxococcota bacterium]|nr:hypothetical protein [Myxococcota bacterium]